MEKRATARDLFGAIYGLRTFLVGYEEALIQAALALLTRNHMFLVGPTGQGKSTFLTLLSEVFDGVAIFRPQLSAFTIPDHLIGPPIPSVYRREGKQLYYTDGGIVDAQLALIEEWPDAGVALARSLNTILLERRFVTKDQIYTCRLHSAFMTGNHAPHGEQWDAVNARQLFFFQAPRLKTVSSRFSAMESADMRLSGKCAHEEIHFADVETMSHEVESVHISPGVMLVLAWCLSRFEERCNAKTLPGHLMNTRSQNNLLPVLRAISLVKGHRDVQYEHLRSLRHVLPAGENEDFEEARRIWSEVVEVAVPSQKHLQQFQPYEQLGALMDQLHRLRLSPHTAREFVFDLPFTAIKLFGETGFNDWLAKVKGLTTLSDLVEEVRRVGIETFRERSHNWGTEAVL
jgi:energy-coupling factor transporter ATP-binding protein EcfA2